MKTISLLKDSRGMSLIEVTIASAIAVAVSMVVMKISENANKSIEKVESDTELINLQNHIQSALSNADNCKRTMEPYDVKNPGGLEDGDYTPDFGTSSLKFGTPTSFNLAVWTDPSNSSLNATETFEVDKPIPRHPHWYLEGIRIYEMAHSSGGDSGLCQIRFEVSRDTKTDRRRTIGVQNKIFQVTLACSVTGSPSTLNSCMALTANSNTIWKYRNSANVDLGIHHVGPVVVGPDLYSTSIADATLDVNGDADISGKTRLKDDVTIYKLLPPSLPQNESPSLIFQTPAVQGSMQLSGIRMEHKAPISRFNGNFEVTGLTKLEGATTMNNTLTVAGNATMSNNLTVSGNVTVGSYVRIDSDERLKENEEKIENASEKLEQLTGYTYVLRRNNREEMGLLAQEVQKVFPLAVDSSGEYLSVAYGMLVPVLIEAHKEQESKIRAQQLEIDQLRENIQILFEEVERLKNPQQVHY